MNNMRNPSADSSRRLLTAFLLAALCPFVASFVIAPHQAVATAAAQGETIWDGVYSDEQAERGMQVYEQECAACHLDDLMGDGIAPALVGSSFFFRWSELSVGDMYAAIRTTMPQGAPASLSPSGYAEISAYLLQKNNVPSGADELPSDMDDLEAITITESK
jgi:mono/diheme cytochrome c family protein